MLGGRILSLQLLLFEAGPTLRTWWVEPVTGNIWFWISVRNLEKYYAECQPNDKQNESKQNKHWKSRIYLNEIDF